MQIHYKGVITMRNKISSVEYNIIKKANLLYHQNLATDPEKIRQVKEIFGINEESIKIYQIGYCDGSNQNLFPDNEEILNNLKKTFFLTSNGEELFKGCITIPIYNEKDQLTEIAGLPLKSGKIKKRYIKVVKENSFLNWQCFRIHKEIFVTYNIPLFFEAIQKGIKNIVPIMTNFISDSQIRVLRENGIEKIYFTFECNDKAILNRLKQTRISLYNLPIVSFLDIEQNTLTKLYEKATPIFPNEKKTIIEKKSDTNITKINNGYEFQFKKRRYRVLGIKEDFVSNLRVVIKVKQGENNFFDTIDLYSSRARNLFIKEMIQKLNFDQDEKEVIEKELISIVEHIEKEREKAIKEKSQGNTEYILTREEKEIGLKFLKSKNIFNQIDEDMTKLGYVGERINKIICYLVATSRKMESPLASIIVSRSAAGKSRLVETIEKLMPQEDIVSMTASTDQAFYYMTDGMLKHKLVTISEQEGKATADYPIRELLSRKYLSKAMPVKDKSGNTRTVFIKVEGPISYIETTTNFNIHPENASRCFQMYIDESEEQTERIHQFQKLSKTKEYFLNHLNKKEIIKKHHCAQRLLKPIVIFNPYVNYIRFPVKKLRTRRDHEKFLNLIEVITFLFQYQREKKKLRLKNGKEIEYIESTIEDYRNAYQLLTEGILQNTLDDLLKSSKDLLQLIIKMVEEKAIKEKKAKEEVLFTRRMIMEYTNWSFSQVRDHIKNLIDFELIEIVRGKNNGQRHLYRLSPEIDSKDDIYTSLIPSPDELEREIKEDDKLLENLTNLSQPVGIQVLQENIQNIVS